jgi:hypothetical protein
MAQFQDDIVLTVLKAKDIAGKWAVCFIEKENNGESLGCCEMKLMLLVKWIRLMESFYSVYFGDNGMLSPTDPCLALAQGQLLLAKIKKLIK